jgi:hypothetical protein
VFCVCVCVCACRFFSKNLIFSFLVPKENSLLKILDYLRKLDARSKRLERYFLGLNTAQEQETTCFEQDLIRQFSTTPEQEEAKAKFIASFDEARVSFFFFFIQHHNTFSGR